MNVGVSALRWEGVLYTDLVPNLPPELLELCLSNPDMWIGISGLKQEWINDSDYCFRLVSQVFFRNLVMFLWPEIPHRNFGLHQWVCGQIGFVVCCFALSLSFQEPFYDIKWGCTVLEDPLLLLTACGVCMGELGIEKLCWWSGKCLITCRGLFLAPSLPYNFLGEDLTTPSMREKARKPQDLFLFRSKGFFIWTANHLVCPLVLF